MFSLTQTHEEKTKILLQDLHRSYTALSVIKAILQDRADDQTAEIISEVLITIEDGIDFVKENKSSTNSKWFCLLKLKMCRKKLFRSFEM